MGYMHIYDIYCDIVFGCMLYMYIYMYIYICMHMYVCMYVCICMYVYVCICMHMYAHVCICMYMYVYNMYYILFSYVSQPSSGVQIVLSWYTTSATKKVSKVRVRGLEG